VLLAEMLWDQGYRTALVTDTYHMLKPGMGYARGFEHVQFIRGQEGDPYVLDETLEIDLNRYELDPDPNLKWTQHLIQYLRNRHHWTSEGDHFVAQVMKASMRWLDTTLEQQRDKLFLWIDSFDPHEPWDPPQYYTDLYDPGYTGRVFEAPTYGVRKTMGITDRELNQIRARYAGEVTMVDACVGRLLATLERLGIAGETLLIFTSDHGTQFDYPGEGGLIQKAHALGADGMCMPAGRPGNDDPLPRMYFPMYPAVTRVPLLVRTPGMQKGKRVKAIVQPWDMTATILDAFGMKKPAELIGESLLPLIESNAKGHRAAAVCGTNALAQAMTDRWIYTVWQNGANEPSLLDLKGDPLAERNVYAENPAVTKRLHGEIARFMRNQGIGEELIARYAL